MADDKFLEIAKKIVVSRTLFEQLYDPIIAPHIPRAQQFMTTSLLRDRDSPGLVGRAKDYADFAEALQQANDVNRLIEFFAKHAKQLFADDQEANVSLQSVTNLKEVFHPGLQVTMGRIAALRRTCRVVCAPPDADVERGSGFLIGPHLVLTNWHVVKSMIDAAGQPRKDSHLAMKLEFDALVRTDGSVEKIDAYAPVAHWLVDFSEAHPHEVAGGGQGRNEAWPNQPDELAQKLDFAIIELEGTPGYERDWYHLEDAPWPKVPNALDLFQFPMGRAMACMPGNFMAPTVFQDNDRPPRILHDVNTVKGSSGGLCLDLDSKAVALHQAGYKFVPGNDRDGNPAEIAECNVAIPLARIAAAAGQKVTERIKAAPRVARTGANGVPIFGRTKFQALVDEAMRGDIRILAVQTSYDMNTLKPRTKIGKSFSTTIMQALLPPQDHVVFTVEAARLTSDAYKAARAIVETVNHESLDKVPAQSAGQTSLDADAAGALVVSVIDAMRSAARDRALWLVIDDLDRNPVMSESTTATFLNALYRTAANNNKLRIVLIGPTQRLPALTGLAVATDSVEEHISDDDVQKWITTELGARLPVLPQFASLMVAIARSVAEETAKNPERGRTGAIADVLNRHWGPKIRAQL